MELVDIGRDNLAKQGLIDGDNESTCPNWIGMKYLGEGLFAIFIIASLGKLISSAGPKKRVKRKQRSNTGKASEQAVGA